MQWRDRLMEMNWIQPFIPSYMKPLDEPAMMNETMQEFIYEAEEFISDLAALSEIPRMNKTFKRSIQGFSYKVKIKPKKIFVEMIDTHTSVSTMKKRVYITALRREHKQEQGTGRMADATIYYQKNHQTIVRSIKKHPSFQSIFYHLHRLDVSLEGGSLESLPAAPPEISEAAAAEGRELEVLTSALKDYQKRYRQSDFSGELTQLQHELSKAEEEFDLLDVEEKHHMKRMILHDVPNLLQTYESLNDVQKREAAPRIQSSFSRMAAFLEAQAADLEATRMDRMNHLLHLNDIRYSPEAGQVSTSSLMKKHYREWKNEDTTGKQP
ncbi:hypothetical protein [Alkalicoccus urumqiensis]|uniref:Uncharacterized protein n=1 Tax=Alkalicoccus urumqiensis TaxID=1548213 RepID=A0A2P6MKR7_ALKUR|nr:hypothetical protein [Alkalicoccus urumqiensis]PRO66868.1 hypothetical protein C6I21_02800 [Alkalicoccus urumqiensis]